MAKEIRPEFFTRNVIDVARDLLGMQLVSSLDGIKCVGRIVEVEAYDGLNDQACHAFRGCTPRTNVMFGPGGYFYVYFIYGMYHCVNVVCDQADRGSAVLIRALEPLLGTETMQMRRKKPSPKLLCRGPGNLCNAMAIDRSCNGLSCLTKRRLWLEPDQVIKDSQIQTGPRVGISRSVELEWRFVIKNNPFVSKGN
ncbi:MAG: DNA-3-methyladenine glycosylase [Bdellovibrionales bacterium]|nr:DNA-3-methyladenine glycosylase [Bdellovibrionales bacterium]